MGACAFGTALEQERAVMEVIIGSRFDGRCLVTMALKQEGARVGRT